MKKRRIISAILIMACLFSTVSVVQATTISDIKKQKQENQEKLDQINDAIGDLQGEQGEVNQEMKSVNGELVETIASVNLLEEEIAQKEVEIEKATADYEVAKADEEAQYEAMKIRIKFMYERGEIDYVDLFVKASSFSDMLNKAEYIEKLYQYDRELLIKFQEIKQKVADLKEQLEIEQSELEASKGELEEEKAALEDQLAELKAVSDDYAVQIAKAQEDAKAFKAKIQEQTAQIAKLEEEERKRAEEEARRKKEEEERKKKEQQANNSNSDSNSSSSSGKTAAGSYSYDSSQIYAANGSDLGKQVASYACTFIGNPYVAGGTSLTNGADCSGFTQAVYRKFGYSIPRNSAAQRSAGTEVSYEDAQPGDLICYAGHVAMYIGNGKIVHASSAKTGIKIGYATYKTILSVRRII